MNPTRTLSGDRGAVTVEFALAAPILMVLLLGTVSGGLLLNRDLQLSHAGREGARYGATVAEDENFVSGTWAEHVRDHVLDRSAGELTAPEICVALVSGSAPLPLSASHTTHTTAGNPAPCFDDSGGGDDSLRVQVSVGTDGTLEFGLASRAVTLDSVAVAKHETVQS